MTPKCGSVFVSSGSLGSLQDICGEALSYCGCGTAKKNTRRICDAVEREREKKKIRSPSYEVEWLYKWPPFEWARKTSSICRDKCTAPFSDPMAFSLGMNIDF